MKKILGISTLCVLMSALAFAAQPPNVAYTIHCDFAKGKKQKFCEVDAKLCILEETLSANNHGIVSCDKYVSKCKDGTELESNFFNVVFGLDDLDLKVNTGNDIQAVEIEDAVKIPAGEIQEGEFDAEFFIIRANGVQKEKKLRGECSIDRDQI